MSKTLIVAIALTVGAGAWPLAAHRDGLTDQTTAQALRRPDFTGHWEHSPLNGSATELMGLLVSLCGGRCDIVSSGTTLKISRQRTFIATPEVFTIDWTQSRDTRRDVSGGGTAPPVHTVWTSEWQGDSLVVTSRKQFPVSGVVPTNTAKHVLSLSDGKLLIHTTTSPLPSSGRPTAVTSEYHKRLGAGTGGALLLSQVYYCRCTPRLSQSPLGWFNATLPVGKAMFRARNAASKAVLGKGIDHLRLGLDTALRSVALFLENPQAALLNDRFPAFGKLIDRCRESNHSGFF